VSASVLLLPPLVTLLWLAAIDLAHARVDRETRTWIVFLAFIGSWILALTYFKLWNWST
jgi:hypothetical protein